MDACWVCGSTHATETRAVEFAHEADDGRLRLRIIMRTMCEDAADCRLRTYLHKPTVLLDAQFPRLALVLIGKN
jgi:hypothetical protein